MPSTALFETFAHPPRADASRGPFLLAYVLASCTQRMAVPQDVPHDNAVQDVSLTRDVPTLDVMYDAPPTICEPPLESDAGTRGWALELSAARAHTCASTTDGVLCWGANFSGQLGDGTHTSATRPVRVAGLGHVRALASGGDSSCAVRDDGSVVCWGANDVGQLGDGSRLTRLGPVQVVNLSNVEDVCVGSAHACARMRSGVVYCWGAGTEGQLGDTRTQDSNRPVLVNGIATSTALSCGLWHTCAVLADGTVRCWGLGEDNQLGNCAQSNKSSPVHVEGLSNVTRLSAGARHTCALDTQQRVFCWGDHTRGQQGRVDVLGCAGNTSNAQSQETPGLAALTASTVSVACGALHTCAINTQGEAFCWGAGTSGQRGECNFDDRATPSSVAYVSAARKIAAGDAHTCVVTQSGDVWCWGSNVDGQLGNGTLQTQPWAARVQWLIESDAGP